MKWKIFKEETQRVHNYFKKCSSSDIKKIKNLLRCHPLWSNGYHKDIWPLLERMWEKKNPVLCWWGNKLIQTVWKSVWRFLQKVKVELPSDPAISLFGIYPENFIFYRRDICIFTIIVVLFISENGANLNVISWWLDNINMVYVYLSIIRINSMFWLTW